LGFGFLLGQHYQPVSHIFQSKICILTPNNLSFGYYSVGFTDGSNPVAGRYVGGSPNSYGISEKRGCWLSGKEHKLECPCGAIAGGRVAGQKHNFDRPIGSFDAGDVFGSGLLLNSKNELAVFFTVNGILLGKLLLIYIINDLINNFKNYRKENSNQSYSGSALSNDVHFSCCFCGGQFWGQPRHPPIPI
jgi:hypothetical protein